MCTVSKSERYRRIDPIFKQNFNNNYQTQIRLDEIRWGGVRQDGIPPLRQPKMITAEQANYLNDNDIIFGIEVNDDIRAYPKRILAWHEMFIDDIGGVAIAGVYCTLCGTVIIYDTKVNGVKHDIGTSGFLYRCNKLIYDKKTQSLWSTFSGAPVVGPLVDKNTKLAHRYVVTTTWAEWKERHPKTKVLSLDTGYRRDYREGVAYQQYFSNDELMFAVPKTDSRLKNKDQILGLLFNRYPNQALAISVNYLTSNPLYHNKITQQSFVILPDNSGTSRVYDNRGIKFIKWDKEYTAIDETGKKWHLSEAKLSTNNGDKLPRLPANRAFWYAAYSHTRLIK